MVSALTSGLATIPRLGAEVLDFRGRAIGGTIEFFLSGDGDTATGLAVTTRRGWALNFALEIVMRLEVSDINPFSI